MNPYALMSLLVSVIAFYTAVFIYYRNPKNELNILISNLGVIISLMAFVEFVYRVVETASNAYFWLKLSTLWPIIPALLLHISLVFSKRRVNRPILLLIYAPAFTFIGIGLFTNLLISDPVMHYYGWTYSIPPDPTLFTLFSIWTVAVTLIAAIIAFRYFLDSMGYRRRESLYIFLGLFITLIISFTTDYVLRNFFGFNLPELTQTMSAFGLLLISYGIWRYEFPLLSPALTADRIVATMPNFLIITDIEGKITSFSRSLPDKLSYKPGDLEGLLFYELFDENEREILKEVIGDVGSSEMESHIISASGRHLDVIVTVSPIKGRFKEPVGFVVIATDISLQRRATEKLIESELRFRGVVEEISDGIAITDESDSVVYWNLAIENITGIKREDAIGKDIKDLCSYVIIDEIGVDEYLINGNRIVSVARFEVKGESALRCVLVRDITDARRYEESLHQSLMEKETLLREIHHRVKNNLQIISSLLNLQKPYLRDEEDLRIFEESQNRIKSMAMIHENLYQSETLSEIEFSHYLSRLTNELLSTYGRRGVKVDISCDDIKLNIETAVPLALITNELLTNALKYAFPDDEGTVSIAFTDSDGFYQLNVSDNGVGLPEDFDIVSSESLGMNLIRALVDQLDGELEVDGVDGASFRIRFPPS